MSNPCASRPATMAAFTSSQDAANQAGNDVVLTMPPRLRSRLGRQSETLVQRCDGGFTHLVELCRRIDDAEPVGVRAREFEIAIAYAVEELRGLDLESIDRAAPRLHAFETDAHRHVEQDRAIRIQVPVHGVRDLIDELAVDAASAALVGMRGIGEAITQHPFAARERGTDEVVDVHLARTEHEQRLRRGADVFLATLEHERAHALRELRAAGVARRVNGHAAGAQRLRQAIGDGRLAGDLDRFERDESGRHHRGTVAPLPLAPLNLARYRATAALYASSVAENSCEPSPFPVATKKMSPVSSGRATASMASFDGNAIGVGGSPARV